MKELKSIEIKAQISLIMKVMEKRLQSKVKEVIRKTIIILPDNRFFVFLLKRLF